MSHAACGDRDQCSNMNELCAGVCNLLNMSWIDYFKIFWGVEKCPRDIPGRNEEA